MRSSSVKTTTDRATVAQMIVQELNDLMLNSRDALPKERNGRPRAPSNPRAAQIRKDIGQERANPFGMLVTVGECDLRDGVAFSEVVGPLRRLIAHYEAVAVEAHMHRHERPLITLMCTELKAQTRLDLAQLRAAESPESVEALAEVIREADAHKRAIDEMQAAALRKLASVRAHPHAGVGARRMALV